MEEKLTSDITDTSLTSVISNTKKERDSSTKKYQQNVIASLSVVNASLSSISQNIADQNVILQSIDKKISTVSNLSKDGGKEPQNVTLNFKDSKFLPNFLDRIFGYSNSDIAQKITVMATSIYDAIVKISTTLPYAEKASNAINMVVTSLDSISKIGIKTFAGIAGGIALLGLSIFAFDLIPIESIVKFGIIMYSLAKISKALIDNKTEVGFTKFAVSLSLLGLSLWAFNEIVDGETIMSFSVSMLVIGATLSYFISNEKGIKKATSQMNSIGISFGIMALSLLAYNYVEYQSIVKAGLTLSILTASLYAMSKTKVLSTKDAISFAIISSSLIPLAVGLMLFDNVDYKDIIKGNLALLGLVGVMYATQKLNISAKTIATLALSSVILIPLAYGIEMFKSIDYNDIIKSDIALLGLVGVMGIAGTLGTKALIGAIVLGVGALALYGLSFALKEFMSLNITTEKLGMIGLTVAGLIATFALVGAASTFITAGAIAIGAMSLSLFALVTALNYTNNLNVNNEKIALLGTSVMAVISSLSYLANPLISIAVIAGSITATALSVGLLALTLSMGAIDKINVPSVEKMVSFEFATNKLGDIMYNIGGVIRSPFIITGSLTATAMAVSTVAIAGALALFTRFAPDNKAITSATKTVDIFITSIANTFDKNKEKMDSVYDGIKSLNGITSLISGIAKTVNDIGNMQFIESDIVNGKMIQKSVRSFKESDFANVGISIGKIISALTDPLAAISSKNDTIDIAGISITNPFSNAVENGIDSLKNIGSVFTPLTNIIDTMSKVTDVDTLTKNINKLFVSVFDTIGTTMVKYSDTVEDVDNNKVNNGLSKIMNVVNLLGGNVGVNATNNMIKLTANVSKFKDSINAIDLNKLTKFESMTMHIDGFDEESLKLLSESIEQLSEMLSGSNIGNTNTTTNINNESQKELLSKTRAGVGWTVKEDEKPIKDDIIKLIQEGNDTLIASIKELIDKIGDGTLRGTVRLADSRFGF